MSYKKIISFIGLAFAATLLVACGSKTEEKNTISVGLMTMTKSDKARWDKIEELLKKENVTLKFKEFTDYSQPNKAVANKEVDINAFQHKNFLNNWNKENKKDLVAIADTYISPINLFLERVKGKQNINLYQNSLKEPKSQFQMMRQMKVGPFIYFNQVV
ncbi:MetQ/NlpA family ABC transporter substrate-binding protein [Streptococcus didelphis]|uniref:MetQ/NlpA family ABC transporter substrate-binding protein n=1 Tax=Streptococcus didelphis TaxID=102886 RepID=UPI003524DE55